MAFCPQSLQPVFQNGAIVYGAQAAAFDAGTSTPRALFSSSALDPTRQLPRPVPVGADGVFPPMYAGVGDYDLVITGPNGATIKTIVGLQGDPKPTSGGATFDPLRQLPTGAVVMMAGTGRMNGFVRANGLDIGSSASAAVERNNDDTLALFTYFWNQGSPVIGGRGASAAADFAANKTLNLPNLQNRVPVGITDMGNAGAAASLAGSGYGSITPGLTGGEAGHTLSTAELPAHNHDASFSGSAVGNHQHTGTTDGENAQHNHAVYVKPLNFFNGASNGGLVQTYVPAAASEQGNAGVLTYPTGTESVGHLHGLTTGPSGGFVPSGSVSVNSTGSGSAHNVMQPFTGVMCHLKL